jgi:putative tryptophan/tyrosine transport system substrate-binding protein
MRRREFIATLSGFGTKWAADSVGAHAEQRKSRVGALMVIAESDPDAQRFVKAIETQLDAAGWHNGRNLEITYRWGASDPQLLADYAQEPVVSAPDVLLALGTPALVPLHKATTTIPIVFTSVSDPVAQGFVASLARPGGNITGFANFEPNIGAKWLQLLKEVAPSVTQTNVMFNPNTSPYNSLWMHSIEIASPSFGVSTSEMVVQSKNDIKSGIELLATKTGSSLVVPSDSFTFRHSAFIVELAGIHRIPAVYAYSRFAYEGGLIAYGIDLVEQFGEAAAYIDRVLKGTKPADLPVQAPTRYTMVINLKSANALGLSTAPALLAAADEVVE